MKIETLLLVAAGLYLYSKYKANPAVSGTGLQTCMVPTGQTFPWLANQNCPGVDIVANGVPYELDPVTGQYIPVTY